MEEKDNVSSDEEVQRMEPVEVAYCPHCSMPFEYCEYSPVFEKCSAYLKEKNPELLATFTYKSTEEPAVASLSISDSSSEAAPSESAAAPAPAEQKAEKKAKAAPVITIHKFARNRTKFTTVVRGLEHFGPLSPSTQFTPHPSASIGLDLKSSAKLFSKKFACSSSVVRENDIEEIQIQGDVEYDLPDIIENELKVDSSNFYSLDTRTGKKTPLN